MLSRRSFMQSIGSMMAAMTLGVRGGVTKKPTVNFDLFTDTIECARYNLQHPWSVNGIIAATDARILVTTPGELSGDADARVPDLGKLCWSEFDTGGFRPFIGGHRVKCRRVYTATWCGTCGGIGQVGGVIRKCRTCGGDWDADGIGPECPDCFKGFVGGTKCPDCKGGKFQDDDQAYDIRVGDSRFCAGYIARIKTIGDVDVKVVPVGPLNNQDGDILLFRGDNGVRGMLMGLSPDV